MGEIYPQKALEMAVLINEARKKEGLEPLYCTPYLMECAAIRAQEISVTPEHFRPNGDYFATVVDYDIVNYRIIDENIAGGSETAEGAMEQFRESPRHWGAITNPNVTHMGVGMYYDPNGAGGFRYYWEQLFTADWRSTDEKIYEYDGQYYPEDAEKQPIVEIPTTVTISCKNGETGEGINVATIGIEAKNTKNNVREIAVFQDDTAIEPTISTADGKVRLEFTTTDKVTLLKNMPVDTYYIYITFPKGYHQTSYNQTKNGVEQSGNLTIESEFNDVYEITATGAENEFSIALKDAETGEFLSGEIQILCTKWNSQLLYKTFVTGNEPLILRGENAPEGDYTVTEKTSINGYIKAETAAFYFDYGISSTPSIRLADENKSGIVEGNMLVIPHKKRIIVLSPITYENSIRVFDLSEKQDGFRSNGLAVLRPTSCTSHKNSDIWDVDLVHPFDEYGKWKYLLPENVLKINGQLFRIDTTETEYSEKGGTVTVHAQHISYDLNDYLIEDAEFEGGNAQDFIDFCNEKSYYPIEGDAENLFYDEYKFAITSDITKVCEGDKYTNVSVMAALIGADNCLLNRYGGEIYRDNFYISIRERMENARDNAFFLQYGANVSGIKQRIDYTDFCTALDCVDNFNHDFSVSYTPDSRSFFHHRRRRYRKLNYPDSATGKNQIGNDGSALFGSMNTPKITYTINVNQLKNDPRYEDFRKILDCDYGDCGVIYCPELDINTTQKIIGIDKDEILNEITKIELGNIVSSLIRPSFMGDTVSSGHALSDRLK